MKALGGGVRCSGGGHYFQLSYAPPGAEVERSAGLVADGLVLFDGRVLLVEDNEINRLLNAGFSSRWGLRPTSWLPKIPSL